MHSFKNDYREDLNYENSLGSVVLHHFMNMLKTTDGIIPEIVLTNQGKLAKNTLITMLNSLSKESKIYEFIQANYKLPISVVTHNEINLEPQFKYSLPLNLKKIESKLSNFQLSESGLYIFKHSSGKFAIGSAINFQRRLRDHMSSINGHRIMQKLHSFTKNNGGLNELTWSPLIITPNFYKLFISLYPNYVFTKGEIQILIALTQFMPRVLEQCYILHYKPELNGNKKRTYNIIFSFTKWNPDLLLIKSVYGQDEVTNKYNIYRAIDENNIIVASSPSMNGLATILGISLAGLKYHLGRESYVYAKALALNVNILKLGEISKGNPKDHYRSKKLNRENLELKNISLSSLDLGYVYVFNLDKETIFIKKSTSPSIFKSINPNISANLDSKTIKSKSDNMATYINKELKYSSELGEFFLAKNPHYAINAKSPIIVVDIETNIATFLSSKRECARFLSDSFNKNIQLGTLSRNNWIDSGELIKGKFVLLSKPHFISLMPKSFDLNEKTIDLTKYNVNVINHKYNLSS
jgi:hypothetical protein